MSQQVDDVRIDTESPSPIELVFIWAGPVGLIGVFACWIFAGMMPPKPTPGWSAVQVADFFAENHLRVIVGQIGSLVAAVVLTAFFATVSMTMAQIEGKRPILAVTQIAAWTTLLAFFFLPATIWMVAAYRPGELDPEVIRMLNDFAWFCLLVPLTPMVLQFACLACAVLRDRSPDPVWPRWFGWYTIQAALVVPLSLVIPLVHDGPFTWNGILGFWIPAGDAGVVFIGLAVFMHLAWKRRSRAALAAATLV